MFLLDAGLVKYEDLLLRNKYTIKREFEKNDTNADWRMSLVEELLNIRENQHSC